MWPWSLVVSATLLVCALITAITGFVPTIDDPEVVLSVMLFCVGMALIALPLTFVAGLASDIRSDVHQTK